MKQKFKGLLIGIILGAIISAATAFAINANVQKELAYRNIKIVVDGTEITTTDANGNYMEFAK